MNCNGIWFLYILQNDIDDCVPKEKMAAGCANPQGIALWAGIEKIRSTG